VPITIQLKRNGPYTISAEDADQVVVLDAEGVQLVPEPGRRIALCRCGGSSTKPFCDGTHRRNGFVGLSETRTPTDNVPGVADPP
jgi:3-phenylpropionate/trans-cinnamate dioxygenase ferredoxin subunit